MISEVTRPRRFDELATEQLRRMAEKTDAGTMGRRANWSDWTREMLLAFFTNRHGAYLPEEYRQ